MGGRRLLGGLHEVLPADAIGYVKSLNDLDTAVVDSNYAKINDPFLAGDLDLIFNGNWALADYRNARDTLAVGSFLSGPGGEGRTMTGTDGWYINAADGHLGRSARRGIHRGGLQGRSSPADPRVRSVLGPIRHRMDRSDPR